MTIDNNATRSVFVTGLINAHALENQALTLMDRQLERLERYPDVAEQLRLHRKETEVQIERLEDVLQRLSESHSSMKDAMTSLSGNIAALMHTVAEDEILKNSFANHAFENYEIASYKSLITIAEHGSFAFAVPALEATLQEEERMANWLNDHIRDVTLRYLSLEESGAKAGR